jgi:hypothetical protein
MDNCVDRWLTSLDRYKGRCYHIEPFPEEENEEETKREMRPMQLDMLSEMDDAGSSMAMDVDDLEAMEILNEGGLVSDNKLADADFFNKFDDDFDDTDIN